MIVDRNQVQSDTWVSQVSDLGDLEREGARVRLGGRAAATATTSRALAETLEALAGEQRPELVSRETLQGRRRLVHGAARPAAHRHGAVRLPLRRAGAGGVRAARSRRSARGSTSGWAQLGAAPVAARGGRAARAPVRAAASGSGSSRPTARRCLEAAEREPRLVALDADLRLDTRPRRVPRALPRALLRVRDRRAGHGLAGRRDGARRAAPGRATRSPASSRRGRTSRSTTTRPRARR